jgi:hypothetical protein
MLGNNNPNNRQSSQNWFVQAAKGLSATIALITTVIYGGTVATMAQGVIAPTIFGAYQDPNLAKLAIDTAWVLTFPGVFFGTSATLYGTFIVLALKIAKWLF